MAIIATRARMVGEDMVAFTDEAESMAARIQRSPRGFPEGSSASTSRQRMNGKADALARPLFSFR
jgi:hypothetical protein